MYNVDVVFDTDGTFLAKYRKLNLWGESYMSVPQNCPIASFQTGNITFGLFTCADLIYSYPALSLVEQGVKASADQSCRESLTPNPASQNFIMPAAWSDEMAQMQAP
jgi:predicted amidohydrolase